MRLSLNGWPPLASHLACLLLGASIANLHKPRKDSLSSSSLPSGTIALVINRHEVKAISLEKSKFFYVAKVQKDAVCLLNTPPVEMIDSEAQRVIKTKITNTKSIIAVSEALQKRNLALIGSENISKYEKCSEHYRIRYSER